ncbi:hypothetical protein [Olivibacter sp. XZL3]|uniref:hypothetical protein n=1 Tax=Olivibacter sp. XZL3 TaxID=1735116 RepID=UPI00197EF3C0|nr:hypothetical protein [Olivibacter sp. XZL3]
MKKLSCILSFCLCFSLVYGQTTSLAGAWQLKKENLHHTLVLVDNYLSYSVYNIEDKKFVNTWGGPYKPAKQADHFEVTIEYNALKPEEVQKKHAYQFNVAEEVLDINVTGEVEKWQRLDNNDAPLAGVWRITNRKVDDKLQEMPLRDRRTLKILSGTRFQWVAINIKTGEFSGTGGGTYTFSNGKYTENIDFFSRDGSRVGTALAFDGKLEEGKWHHSGLSSKGDPIYEIWSRMYQ